MCDALAVNRGRVVRTDRRLLLTGNPWLSLKQLLWRHPVRPNGTRPAGAGQGVTLQRRLVLLRGAERWRGGHLRAGRLAARSMASLPPSPSLGPECHRLEVSSACGPLLGTASRGAGREAHKPPSVLNPRGPGMRGRAPVGRGCGGPGGWVREGARRAGPPLWPSVLPRKVPGAPRLMADTLLFRETALENGRASGTPPHGASENSGVNSRPWAGAVAPSHPFSLSPSLPLPAPTTCVRRVATGADTGLTLERLHLRWTFTV